MIALGSLESHLVALPFEKSLRKFLRKSVEVMYFSKFAQRLEII